MAFYYSLKTNGWYDTEFAEYLLPEDVIELSKGEWDTLRINMNKGQILSLNSEGNLFWADPPYPDLEEVKSIKIKKFTQLCQEEIENTQFSSTASGKSCTYDCRLVDQINLKIRCDVARNNQTEEPIWTTSGEQCEWKKYTPQQLEILMKDMNSFIKNVQEKLMNKIKEIQSSKSTEEVDKILW